MITMICGLIGAGKTTYASKRFPKISDLDFMSGISITTTSTAIRRSKKQS